MPASTEAASSVDFSHIRYAQVWEDADILVEALCIQPTDTVVSIASAGDNALALLGAGAARVVALDLNPAQLACLELRVAAYRNLTHQGLLVLMGSRPGTELERWALYQRCHDALSPSVAKFWDERPALVKNGIGAAGKFENYFRLFRTKLLPWVHSQKTTRRLLQGGSAAERREFYDRHWNTWRWRLLFRVFFSRFMMGRLGRDPAFFKYVEGSVADRILARTEHALTAFDPADNPYLHWILTGTHGTALPWALREENFEKIRSRLDRLEWHEMPIEAFLEREAAAGRTAFIDKLNLSDIFEYMSEANTADLLARLADASRPGARFAYWNMLVPRSRPASLAHRLFPQPELARRMFAADKAFFYSAFIVEDVR